MKNRLFILLAIVALVVVMFVVGYKFGRQKAIPLPSYGNTNICETLRPGISINELIMTLGGPVGAMGDYVLFSPSPTARAIKVKVDFDTTKVTELICDPDRGVTWTYAPVRKK